MDDFKAKVCKGRVEDIVGDYGPRERNVLAQEENLIKANISFQLPVRGL